MKLLMMALVLTNSILALAATEGGGGGDVVVCYKDNKIKDMQLYDIWNTGPNREYRLSIERDFETPYMEQLARTAKRLSRLDIGFAEYLLEHGKNFAPENINNELVSLVPSISIDGDGKHRVLPNEPGCDKVVIKRIAQFNINPLPFGSKFLIAQGLWEHAPDDTKAALIQHELIYVYAKKLFNEKTSRNTQFFNALISSKEFEELKLIDYILILVKDLEWLYNDINKTLNILGKEFNLYRMGYVHTDSEMLYLLKGEILEPNLYSFGNFKISLETSRVVFETNSERFVSAEGLTTQDFSGTIGIGSYSSPEGTYLSVNYRSPEYKNSIEITTNNLSVNTPLGKVIFKDRAGSFTVNQITGETLFSGILPKEWINVPLQTKFGPLRFSNLGSKIHFNTKGEVILGGLPKGSSQKLTIGKITYTVVEPENQPRYVFKIPQDKLEDIKLEVDFGRRSMSIETLEGHKRVRGRALVHIDQTTLLPRKIFQ